MLPFSEKAAEVKMDLRRKVEEAVRQGKLLEPGMKVAVACSGGADSVALACLLAELKETLGLRLLLVHLNHQLRGAEADADEAFVRKLAERLEVEFLARREDVGARAQRDKTNLEEAGRQTRLEFFASLIAAGKADAVALAHTLDDQAETVLGRLVRGAGTKGLAGIYPVVELTPAGKLVRPLLGIRRGELREYLAEREQAWREDASNLDRRRLRNRIRLELLPQLNPASIEHLGRLAAHAGSRAGSSAAAGAPGIVGSAGRLAAPHADARRKRPAVGRRGAERPAGGAAGRRSRAAVRPSGLPPGCNSRWCSSALRAARRSPRRHRTAGRRRAHVQASCFGGRRTGV